MLFHLTATHTVYNCSGYDRERMPAVIEAIEGSEARAKELGIKVHFMVNAAPKHVIYALVEAESIVGIALWINSSLSNKTATLTLFKHRPILRLWRER